MGQRGTFRRSANDLQMGCEGESDASVFWPCKTPDDKSRRERAQNQPQIRPRQRIGWRNYTVRLATQARKLEQGKLLLRADVIPPTEQEKSVSDRLRVPRCSALIIKPLSARLRDSTASIPPKRLNAKRGSSRDGGPGPDLVLIVHGTTIADKDRTGKRVSNGLHPMMNRLGLSHQTRPWDKRHPGDGTQ